MCVVQPQQRCTLRPREGVYNGLMFWSYGVTVVDTGCSSFSCGYIVWYL